MISADQLDANRALTAVIYGTDRAKFGTPEVALQGQRVCAGIAPVLAIFYAPAIARLLRRLLSPRPKAAPKPERKPAHKRPAGAPG